MRRPHPVPPHKGEGPAAPGPRRPALTARDAIGVVLILAAVVCEALFLILNKKMSRPVPALTLSTLMSLIGLALAIAPAGLELVVHGPRNISPAAIGGPVYYALVPTVLGFQLWYEGASRTSGGEAALLTAVLPVSALALAALVLGKPVAFPQGAGCALVVGAILIGAPRKNTRARVNSAASV